MSWCSRVSILRAAEATGIVRRVDGLSHIVIPKEIRRALRIGEGPVAYNIDTFRLVLLWDDGVMLANIKNRLCKNSRFFIFRLLLYPHSRTNKCFVSGCFRAAGGAVCIHNIHKFVGAQFHRQMQPPRDKFAAADEAALVPIVFPREILNKLLHA